MGTITGKIVKTLIWDVDLCLNVDWPPLCQGHEWPRLLQPQVSSLALRGQRGILPLSRSLSSLGRSNDGDYDNEQQ